MATLTDEQNDFLKSHHIPLDKTFDASGLSSKEYKAKMKENGTLVAYGVPPCSKGHTLKNKQANCLQCNPQAIASIKRQATAGDVYMAVSYDQLLTKIDVVEDASEIAQILNRQNHAGINDWQIAMTGHTESIGQVENHIQQRLSDRQVAKKLTETGKVTKASAIYDVDILDALEVLNEIPFKLTTIDNAVMDNFHARFTDKELQKQQQAEQIAQEQAQRERQKIEEQERIKQQKIAEQKQQQERAKQEKLAQKQQRQQEIDAKKQLKQQQRQQVKLTQLADSKQEQPLLDTPPKTAIPSTTIQSQNFFSNQKNIMWLVIAIILIIVMAVIAYLLMK